MNRLAKSSSLYLRQHAEQPVDWWPWCDEAFEVARAADKPVFLSIGYSSCHWCHVMAHESFDDPTIAALMNELFICIKVDREERPDVDRFYMDVVVAMTGSGGWPMSVFLAPDGVPLYGGTYFPPSDHYGRPGFTRVLRSLAHTWHQKGPKLEEVQQQYFSIFGTRTVHASPLPQWRQVYDRITNRLDDLYDSKYGGWGTAPKFPPNASFMTRIAHGEKLRDQALYSLRMMVAGGIHDQLRGGYHRYSTDSQWLVPHFEKMLYDNAAFLDMLSLAAIAEDTTFRQWHNEALDLFAFLERDLRVGQLYAASIDADDPGGEGFYYTWKNKEIKEKSKEKIEIMRERFILPTYGNFEGRTILSRKQHGKNLDPVHPGPVWSALEEVRALMLAEQDCRQAPVRDNKLLTEWNARLVPALVRWYHLSGDECWRDRATELMHELDKEVDEQRVGHGPSLSGPVQLADATSYAVACVALAGCSGIAWLFKAKGVVERALNLFVEDWVIYPAEQDPLLPLRRAAETADQQTPSEAAELVSLCQLLGQLFDDKRMLTAAEKMLPQLAAGLDRFPESCSTALEALRQVQDGCAVAICVLPEGTGSRPAGRRGLKAGVWTFVLNALDAERIVYSRGLLPSTEPQWLYCNNRTCSLPGGKAPF